MKRLLILLLSAVGCASPEPGEPEIAALHPLLSRLLRVDRESKGGQTQFFQILDDLGSLQGPPGAERPNWTQSTRQKLEQGEAALMASEDRRYVAVVLRALSLKFSGDYPLLILLFSADGKLVDQVLCTGDAFYVRLFLALSEPPSSGVIVASVEGRDWTGPISIEHRDVTKAEYFPKNIPMTEGRRSAAIFDLAIDKGTFLIRNALPQNK